MRLTPPVPEGSAARRISPGFCVLLGLLLVSALAAGSKSPHRVQRFEFARPRMGTIFRIVLYAPTEAAAQRAAGAAFRRIEELDTLMSDYRADSELMRLCRWGHQSPRPVSEDLFLVLESALMFSRMSGGAFDVTIGPMVELWRQARRSGKLPEAAELARARDRVGYEKLVLEAEHRTVYLRREGMKLDLGGIAKGYAADQAVRTLRAQGIESALIDAGGDVRLGSPPPGRRGWVVAVTHPDPSWPGPLKELLLHNSAVATSGDTEQFVEIGGVRYSHIVDPAMGLGVRDSASATVIASDGMTADALATALSVLPPEEGLRLVDSIPGAAAYVVRRVDGKFQGFVSSRANPW